MYEYVSYAYESQMMASVRSYMHMEHTWLCNENDSAFVVVRSKSNVECQYGGEMGFVGQLAAPAAFFYGHSA